MITLVIWRRYRLLDRLLPARFGYPTNETSALGVEAWLEAHPVWGCVGIRRMHTYSNKLILRRLCWEATCCWCVHSSVSNVVPHWVCFKPLRPKQQSFDTYPNLAYAAVFHLSKPCSSLSRIQILHAAVFYVVIQTLQQSRSFTYPNLAAVFHVSKSCSSLSHIQTLPAATM